MNTDHDDSTILRLPRLIISSSMIKIRENLAISIVQSTLLKLNLTFLRSIFNSLSRFNFN